jgi:hypothetical protein
MLEKRGGYKLRQKAEDKLTKCTLPTGPQSVGFVISNYDGTFTPVVWLLGNDLVLARNFAEQGIQVIGGG